MRKINTLVMYANTLANQTFSYQIGWPYALQNHSLFACNSFNISSNSYLKKIKTLLKIKFRKPELILIMHSVFSNTNLLRSGALFDMLCETNIPIVYFIGNEYKSIPEKINFSRNLGISMLVTQSNSHKIHQIYREAIGCQVIGLPNTGINPDVFKPMVEFDKREIDIGYRATSGTMYLGHNERNSIAQYFNLHGSKHNLTLDISTDETQRFTTQQWALFLNKCKGQIGSEAGYDYFETNDETRLAVNKYTDNNPEATFQEVYEKFFENYGPKTPMRIISGRNIEAAGTKTVQILLEGKYGGYFQPDTHYIALKKDFTNFDEVVDKFSDPSYSSQIAANAYDLVMSELTYDKILNKFHEQVQLIL